MPRNKPVSKRAPEKLSRVGKDVIRGLKESAAHARGEISLRTYEYDVPGPVDVKAIRAKSGLSQSQFARRYGFSTRTLQDWELGRFQPPSAVRAYLTVIDRFPEAVEKALLGAA
ncbi:MAG: helix-turn-helix domain-containing protein [Bryobacteraceae bacterium]